MEKNSSTATGISQNTSFRNSAHGLFFVIFERQGNVFFAVLPYCLLNCALFGLVEWIEHATDIQISFSPTGHGLMTLLVSFLVISKVNLAYERYREARRSVGDAFGRLRELGQWVLCLSFTSAMASSSDNQEEVECLVAWRNAAMHQIVQLLDASQRVIQSKERANSLARSTSESRCIPADEDPLVLVQSLRLHLYTMDNDNGTFQLLERVQLVSKLSDFVSEYRRCLELASTPLPFNLVQMGRAFLGLWTFTMPLVLRQGPFSDFWSALVFLFFLTYGFIGLELVAMNLSSPFGDGPSDIRVTALRNAVQDGIERDLQHSDETRPSPSTMSRRSVFSKQKTGTTSNDAIVLDSTGSNDGHGNNHSMYHQMPDAII